VLILTRARVFQFDEAWAGIVVACLLGLVLYIGVAIVERLTLRWLPSTSE
jgi:ABC-type nitrate/sulfonate/bicarbonate transport system permease component